VFSELPALVIELSSGPRTRWPICICHVSIGPFLPPVRASLGRDLPTAGIHEPFEEFQRLGLMFVDEQFVLALAMPTVAGR
jgi:hypothetical protein